MRCGEAGLEWVVRKNLTSDSPILPQMEAVVSMFRTVFATLGLNLPLYRFLGLTALGTGLEFVVRPRYAFDENGSVRPWAIPFMSSPPGAVYTPVGFFPGLAGLVAALFV